MHVVAGAMQCGGAGRVSCTPPGSILSSSPDPFDPTEVIHAGSDPGGPRRRQRYS